MRERTVEKETRNVTGFDGIVHPITAPTLIRDPDNDQYLKGQPHLAEKALTSASTTRGAAAGVGDVGVAGQAMAAGSCRRLSTTMVTLTEKMRAPGSTPTRVAWGGPSRRCSTGSTPR